MVPSTYFLVHTLRASWGLYQAAMFCYPCRQIFKEPQLHLLKSGDLATLPDSIERSHHYPKQTIRSLKRGRKRGCQLCAIVCLHFEALHPRLPRETELHLEYFMCNSDILGKIDMHPESWSRVGSILNDHGCREPSRVYLFHSKGNMYRRVVYTQNIDSQNSYSTLSIQW